MAAGSQRQSRPGRLFRCKRSTGPFSYEPPLLLSQGGIEVKHERVGVGPKLRHDEGNPLGHEPGDESYVPREAIELGDWDRALF